VSEKVASPPSGGAAEGGGGGARRRVGASDPPKPSRAWRWLGLELVESGDGYATVEMTPTEDMANHSGFVHGGMISTLADSAMGRSLRTLVPGVVRAMSFDLKLNFINAAKIGETLRATGRVIHAGRRTMVTECRVEGREGRLIATASATFAVTREKGINESPDAD
jgi:uncharacterized protein (TIGR00369 family)